MSFLPQLGNFTTLAQLAASARGLLPTHLSSAELRSLDADVRRRSVFSARTTNLQYTQAIKDIVDQLAAGEINEATGRNILQTTIDLLGYDPAVGFPGDALKGIPPAEVGTLRDLSSGKRIKFVLDTQERLVSNYGHWTAGQDDLARFAFPAYELVRIFPRDKERDDWPERWVRAGGELLEGRMVAAKDDPVWDALGSSAEFDDGLDNPYPPFAFGSGMGWRDVPREEAIALGIISAGDIPEFQDRELNESLQFEADNIDPALLEAAQLELDAGVSPASFSIQNGKSED